MFITNHGRSSDAGEVPVGNYSQGIHGHQYNHSSSSRTQWLSGQAANQLAQDSIRFQNDGKDGTEEQTNGVDDSQRPITGHEIAPSFAFPSFLLFVAHSEGIHGHQYQHSSSSRTQWLSGQAANQLAQDSIRFQS